MLTPGRVPEPDRALVTGDNDPCAGRLCDLLPGKSATKCTVNKQATVEPSPAGPKTGPYA